MSKFRIYNIQLLPNENGIVEVGVAGYRKLFSKLKEVNADHLRHKTHETFHFSISNGVFYGPYEFHFVRGRVYGYFIKYSPADPVVDIQTGRLLYSRARNASGVRAPNLIPFVWDTRRHFLAIDGALLPKPVLFIDALVTWFSAIAEENFPNHTLTVNLISKPNALEQVFQKAVAYKKIEVGLVFPNGGESEGLLRQLRDSKTQTLNMVASGGKSGRMSGIPEFLKKLLRAAPTYGFAKISYFVPDNGSSEKASTKKEFYNSEEMPLTYTIRHSDSDDSDDEFFNRAAEKLETLEIYTEDPARSDVDDTEKDT